MSLVGSTIQKKLLKVCIGGMCLLQTIHAQDKLYPNAFALQDVQLLKGPFQHARDLNIQTLLQYDTDRLLAGYRKEAGLPAKATIFANWEGLDGHVGGHYLSALAMNYAATGNAECKRRMEYMLAELKQCMEGVGLYVEEEDKPLNREISADSEPETRMRARRAAEAAKLAERN